MFGPQEIHGFSSPAEYNRFREFIEKNVANGKLEEIPPDPDYGRGEIYGGRWFRSPLTGDIWRLVNPDFPFRGLWEPVKKMILK